MNSIKQKYSFNKYFYSSNLNGQGIVVAPKAYFANQSMERKRNCEKPVFLRSKNDPKIQIKEIEKLLERHPDPRDPAGVSAFYEKQCRASCLPTYRIVVDNKDSSDCK